MSYQPGNILYKTPFRPITNVRDKYHPPKEMYVGTKQKVSGRMAPNRTINQNSSEEITKVAYTNRDIKETKYKDASDTLADNIMDYSKGFVKSHIVQDFCRIFHRIDLRLSNSDIDNYNNDGKYIYDLSAISCKTNTAKLSDFDATINVRTGFLKIHVDAFPDDVDRSELFI